ncbi:translation initiation factor 2 [Streptomyces sp. NPDC050619]|uniref:translation initiation factor 2 n=1 Tax=Streptomyces sp. NPDC050619 TaxID=3157214 RepID=UPI00342FC600
MSRPSAYQAATEEPPKGTPIGADRPAGTIASPHRTVPANRRRSAQTPRPADTRQIDWRDTWATGDGRRATGDGRRATGDGRRATGDGRRAILFAARSQNALHRLLDTLPVFEGDPRFDRLFTLVPGSDFSADALTAIERAGAQSLPWAHATRRRFALILAASPKGDLQALHGPRALLPHGAGFSKSIRHEGTEYSPSGLDPAHLLLPDSTFLADLYALAHPSQVARLAAVSPQAAARCAVVGDPLLERFLDSADRRDRYRAALRTGTRTLVVIASTWGEESLLARRPSLPADLAAVLPHDEYQLAFVLHPNERVRLGEFQLEQHLAPARHAGLVLPEAYEEWAAVMIAADAVITDHGSAALYPAALDRPVLAAYDGGTELLPDSPMADLLSRVPRFTAVDPRTPEVLDDPGGIATAIRAHRPGGVRTLTDTVFAEHGQVLERLRAKLYALIGVEPPPVPALPRLLPDPAPAPVTPYAFAVRIRHGAAGVLHVTRHPAHFEPPAPVHHLAAEVGTASVRHTQGAALLYRRSRGTGGTGQADAYGGRVIRTAADWTVRVLADHPGGRRTAALIVSDTYCLVRPRSGPLLSVRIGPCREADGLAYADPAPVLSAVHAALVAERTGPAPTSLTCAIGPRTFAVRLSPASPDEAALPL